MTAALARVVESAKPVSFSTADGCALQQLRDQVCAGEQFLSLLYPIEQRAKECASQALALLQKRRQFLEVRNAGLKQIGLEILEWRRADGYPSLALFQIEYPFVVIERKSDRTGLFWNVDGAGWFISRDLDQQCGRSPAGFQSKNADVSGYPFSACCKNLVLRDGARLWANFSGILPKSARAAIERYRSLFGKDLYIVAEPVSWQVAVIDPDPLLVGWDGSSFWLLDAFDLTPVEEAAAFLSFVKS